MVRMSLKEASSGSVMQTLAAALQNPMPCLMH